MRVYLPLETFLVEWKLHVDVHDPHDVARP